MLKLKKKGKTFENYHKVVTITKITQKFTPWLESTKKIGHRDHLDQKIEEKKFKFVNFFNSEKFTPPPPP